MWQTYSGNTAPSMPISSPQAGGAGGVMAPGGWHPTIIYLLVLVVAEILVIGFLSRTVLR